MKIRILILVFVLIVPPVFSQGGYFAFSSFSASTGEGVGDRDAGIRVGLLHKTEGGALLLCAASYFANTGNFGHSSISGIMTGIGGQIPVGRTVFVSPLLLVGNEKNCWGAGGQIGIYGKLGRFAPGIVTEAVFLHDKGFHPYQTAGVAVQYRMK